MVEWKKLGEICVSLKKEIIKQDNLVTNGKYPVVNSGVTLYGRYNEYNNNGNAFTFASRGEYAGFLTYMSEDFWAGGLCYPYRSQDEEKYLTKFIYEYLKSQELYVMDRLVARGGIPALNKADVEKIQIPVPSITEQTRIVGILDTFTASIENLKQQIAQRRKQYEHYRDQLLDLEGKEGVEMKAINQVANSFTGLTYKPTDVADSGTLVLRSSNIAEDTLSFTDNVYVLMENIPARVIVKEGDVLICVRNGSKRLVGKCAMISKEAAGMAFGAFMTILRGTNINNKYLFYVWQSEKVKKQYKGDEAMPIAQITAKDFQRIIIPVPTINEQQRIVSILDTFEAGIANLEQQLAQRERQYEYYRNQLLTFE